MSSSESIDNELRESSCQCGGRLTTSWGVAIVASQIGFSSMTLQESRFNAPMLIIFDLQLTRPVPAPALQVLQDLSPLSN